MSFGNQDNLILPDGVKEKMLY